MYAYFCTFFFSAYLVRLPAFLVHFNVLLHTVLCFLAHAPISEHAPLLEYIGARKLTVYNIGAPTFLINSQNEGFSAIGACAKKRNNTVRKNVILYQLIIVRLQVIL